MSRQPKAKTSAKDYTAIRSIEDDFGPEHEDIFLGDLYPHIRADYILANLPFNDSGWFRNDLDMLWEFGFPPKGNVNLAWGAALHPPPRSVVLI